MQAIQIAAIMASVVVFLDGSIITIANSSISASLHGGLLVQQWDSDAYTLTLAAFASRRAPCPTRSAAAGS